MPFPLNAHDLRPVLNALGRQEKLLKLLVKLIGGKEALEEAEHELEPWPDRNHRELLEAHAKGRIHDQENSPR